MGEYGTPNVNIPEGFFEIDYRGRHDRMPFPRQAGSWYHWSKVHGSNNIMFAVRLWDLRATDIMQGVVFGTRIDEMGDDGRLSTRLDFDQAFGTVINRYCCQAVIKHPLTPFGVGLQKRGFIPLRDSMQCLTLALENPSASGEYRVLNQFAEVYDISLLARKVQAVAREFGIEAEIAHLENPRKELEEHYYQPDHATLFHLGFRPSSNIEDELRIMLRDLMPHQERIKARADLLIPDIRWDGERARVPYLHKSRPPSRDDAER
jgi:UDP-sulfoquinovose synthase